MDGCLKYDIHSPTNMLFDKNLTFYFEKFSKKMLLLWMDNDF